MAEEPALPAEETAGQSDSMGMYAPDAVFGDVVIAVSSTVFPLIERLNEDETNILVVVGASTVILLDPEGPFSKFTTLPIQIYQWTTRPQDEFRFITAAAIITLLILLLSLNATAVLLRNRFSWRY